VNQSLLSIIASYVLVFDSVLNGKISDLHKMVLYRKYTRVFHVVLQDVAYKHSLNTHCTRVDHALTCSPPSHPDTPLH